MENFYNDKFLFIKNYWALFFFVLCTIILNLFSVEPAFKLLIISLVSIAILTTIEARYFIYYVLIFSYFNLFTDYSLAMSPVDSQKFYAEAFYGGYFDREHISTVIAVGWTYKLISSIVNDTSPQVIVFINFFLHCLSVILLTRIIRIINQKRASLLFVTFSFLSPILLTQLPYLIKDFFSAFFSILSFYFYVKYYKGSSKAFLIFSIIAMIASMTFRVYSPIYTVILMMCTGIYRKYYFMMILLLISGLVVTFGIKAIYYFLFSVLALFFIPNFLEINNFVENPSVTIESLVITCCVFLTLCNLLLKKNKVELKNLIYIIALIGITYAFTSLYRITFTSYEVDGASYLADNFFRKKLPIMYILFFLLFGGNISLTTTNSPLRLNKGMER